MKELEINDIKLEIDEAKIKNFLKKIVYPIAIIDFETFRIFKKNSLSDEAKIALKEKIFSVAILIFHKPSELQRHILNAKKLKLFAQTELPKEKNLSSLETIIPFQEIFYHFLIKKLIKYRVKSLITLDAHTETSLLKTYLTYYQSHKKFKFKVNYFFQENKIFDLYDIWNNDQIINLPEYKNKSMRSNRVGATKKTSLLINNNRDYAKLLMPKSVISNHEIGRTVDSYFTNRICLLNNFLPYVYNHNQNDVLVGAAILAFLYRYC